MVTSVADFGDLQTKLCVFTPTYYTFVKMSNEGQCNGDMQLFYHSVILCKVQAFGFIHLSCRVVK